MQNGSIFVFIPFAITGFCVVLNTLTSESGGNDIIIRSNKTVQDEFELELALKDAKPGDTIELLPFDYTGDFILQDKGSSKIGITLKGKNSKNGKSAKILGSKTALEILGGYWTIKNLEIGSGEIGIRAKGSNLVLNSLTISNVTNGLIVDGDSNTIQSLSINQGDKGITINGNDNVVKSVSCIGQRSYGVFAKSGNNTEIHSITVTEAGKYSVIVGEDSTAGKIESLSVDGIFEVRGHSNIIQSMTARGDVNIIGCKNTLQSSSVTKIFVTDVCENALKESIFIQKRLESAAK